MYVVYAYRRRFVPYLKFGRTESLTSERVRSFSVENLYDDNIRFLSDLFFVE